MRALPTRWSSSSRPTPPSKVAWPPIEDGCLAWFIPSVSGAGIQTILLAQAEFLYIFTVMQLSEVRGLDGCVASCGDAGKLASVSEELVDVEEAADLAQMFRLLGDPTRVRILYALLEAGELCVCDIATVVETSETKVSQAMRLLRGAGVVRNRRGGRNVYYRLDDAHVRLLLDISREHLAHGAPER